MAMFWIIFGEERREEKYVQTLWAKEKEGSWHHVTGTQTVGLWGNVFNQSTVGMDMHQGQDIVKIKLINPLFLFE